MSRTQPERRIKSGYVMVFLPEEAPTRGKDRRVPEHVLKAEGALGRRLRSGEVVHHINGRKSDNRNCNLLICTSGYHRSLHERMSHRYAEEKFGDL